MLKRGDKGPAVVDWQTFLVETARIALPATGAFDATTAAATRMFQRKHGIAETGALDVATLEKARALL